MQQCNRCQIRIRGSKRVCPLCGGALSGTPEDPAFPALPRRKFSRMSAVKLAAFLLIAFLITDALIIYLLNGVPSWMPLAVFSAAVGFVDICILAYFRNNILKNMQFQVVVGIVLSIVIDYSTGWYRWSIHWVFPIAVASVMVATIMTGVILRMSLQEFVLYLLVDTLLSQIQWFFLLTHRNTFPLPALISIASCILLFLGILIFRWRDFFSASSRYFNI